jgi:hypothetical protein
MRGLGAAVKPHLYRPYGNKAMDRCAWNGTCNRTKAQHVSIEQEIKVYFGPTNKVAVDAEGRIWIPTEERGVFVCPHLNDRKATSEELIAIWGPIELREFLGSPPQSV